MPKRRRAPAEILNLATERDSRRLAGYRQKLDSVLLSNRRALGQLFTTGLLFSKPGVRAGRDLLLVHEHLLRVLSLVEQLSHQGDVPSPTKREAIESIFAELDTLLERTSHLTQHTHHLLRSAKDS